MLLLSQSYNVSLNFSFNFYEKKRAEQLSLGSFLLFFVLECSSKFAIFFDGSQHVAKKGGEKFVDFAQEVENEKMLLRGSSFEQLQKETRGGSSAHQWAANAILREEYGNEED